MIHFHRNSGRPNKDLYNQLHPYVLQLRQAWETSEEEYLRVWTEIAVLFYHWDYNFEDRTKTERWFLRAFRKVLWLTTPAQYLKGVHLLAEEAAFMGEDIYVVDHYITHTCHGRHKECGKANMDVRNDGTRNIFCVTCNKIVPRDEKESW